MGLGQVEELEHFQPTGAGVADGAHQRGKVMKWAGIP